MALEALMLYGNLHIGVLNANNAVTHWLDPLNASSLKLNPGAVKTVSRTSMRRDNLGAVLNTAEMPGDGAAITVTNDEFRAEILALQLRGGYSDGSATADAVSDNITVTALDAWLELSADHVAADAVTATGPAAATYTEGTHFVVNRRLGLIKFLGGAAGGPALNAAVTVEYDTLDAAWVEVAGSNAQLQRVALKFDGLNATNKKDCVLRVPLALCVPDGDLEIVAQKIVTGNLKFLPELRAGESAPYYYREDK